MTEISKFYIGSKPGYLPPMFVHFNGKFDWPIGPKINSYSGEIPTQLPNKVIRQCILCFVFYIVYIDCTVYIVYIVYI